MGDRPEWPLLKAPARGNPLSGADSIVITVCCRTEKICTTRKVLPPMPTATSPLPIPVTVPAGSTQHQMSGSLSFSSLTVNQPWNRCVNVRQPTISGTGAATFAVVPYSSTTSTCLQPGLNLGQNQSCSMTVQFNPPFGSDTAYSATMSVVDSDPASPAIGEAVRN